MIVLASLTPALSAGLNGLAAADCMCAANGTRYETGAVVCIRSPAGDWLGRCGKVLNNPSWEKLADGCPVTLDAGDREPPMSQPAPATDTTLPRDSGQG